MRGFGVKYFLTTKLAWNDTNTFPYETCLLYTSLQKVGFFTFFLGFANRKNIYKIYN